MEKTNPNLPAEPDADDRADAIIAADDTGLLGGEQEIVNAEIDEALQQPD
jgi:hypothetical protein